MKPRGISTPMPITVGIHLSHEDCLSVFYLFSTQWIMPTLSKGGKPDNFVDACCLLLLSLVSVLSINIVQSENIYSCILKVIGQVWERKKRISINTNHSYHQCSSPQPISIDIKIKVLINPIGKDGVQDWSI